jgi:hypothetical protein
MPDGKWIFPEIKAPKLKPVLAGKLSKFKGRTRMFPFLLDLHLHTNWRHRHHGSHKVHNFVLTSLFNMVMISN